MSDVALLVIDVQESFRHRPFWNEADVPFFTERLQALIDGAAARQIPVLQVFHTAESGPFACASGHVRTLEAVVIEDNRTGERHSIETRALFVFIGADPNSSWLVGAIELDDHGYVSTGPAALYLPTGDYQRRTQRQPMMLETSRPGVFAAGDVRSGSVKRVASAVGEGSMAIRQIHEYFGN